MQACGHLKKWSGEVIEATLEATHYQITRSSEILGISRKTLLEKRKNTGLNRVALRVAKNCARETLPCGSVC